MSGRLYVAFRTVFTVISGVFRVCVCVSLVFAMTPCAFVTVEKVVAVFRERSFRAKRKRVAGTGWSWSIMRNWVWGVFYMI